MVNVFVSVEPNSPSGHARITLAHAYHIHDALKAYGYHFDGERKTWWTEVHGPRTLEEVKEIAERTGGVHLDGLEAAAAAIASLPASHHSHAKNAKQLLATIDYHSQSSLVTGSGTFPVREELRQMGLVFQRNENGLHPRWCGAPLSPQQEARLCAAAREHGICLTIEKHHADDA